MTAEARRKTTEDLIYLISCALKEITPDPERLGTMDLADLYELSERHMISGIIAIALESAGIRDERFTKALGKAMRRNVIFDQELAAVLQKLEKKEIWHMTLKGAVLKGLYPRIGMRQMADNDILIDPQRISGVDQIMKERGFWMDHKGQVHISYYKPPILNFEMHLRLFGDGQQQLNDYYRDVQAKLLKNEGDRFGYHFSDEDFYIYMIAHEYKHYATQGTGLRSLLDIYVFLNKKGAVLDWAYIGTELEKLGLSAFEEENRSLALHLFGQDVLTEAESEMLDYIVGSGTYGTLENRVNNRLSKYGGGVKGKVRYVFSRIFLPVSSIRMYYPVFLKVPLLLPFLPFYRAFKGIKKHKKMIKAELELLKNAEDVR